MTEVDKTDWLPNYVAEWEAREHQFRKTLDNYKSEIDRRYGVILNNISNALSEQEARLLKIRSIPVIGKWLIQYSERK